MATLPYQAAPALETESREAPVVAPLMPPRADGAVQAHVSHGPTEAFTPAHDPDPDPAWKPEPHAADDEAGMLPITTRPARPQTEAPRWMRPRPLMDEPAQPPEAALAGVRPPTAAAFNEAPDGLAPDRHLKATQGAPSAPAARTEAASGLPVPSPLFAPQTQTAPRLKAPTNIQVPTDSGRTSSHASPDEPHEIHVHIGRIEVTALPDAPTVQTKRRRGKTPMSLDDYLARKRGDAA